MADNLMRLIAEGTGEEGEEEADRELRAAAVESYLDLLDRPKLPAVLLKVGWAACKGAVWSWCDSGAHAVVGKEHGLSK